MPVRLIKVSKNLNVGINTLVEFLHKKGIEIEANPNAKIEDEQYDILIAEFGKDKNIRKEATITREKLHRRDEKRETVAIEGYELPEEQTPRKKTEKEAIETEIPDELRPHFHVVGSIDLDNLHKKKSGPEREEPVKEEIEEIIAPVSREVETQPEAEVEKPAPVEQAPAEEISIETAPTEEITSPQGGAQAEEKKEEGVKEKTEEQREEKKEDTAHPVVVEKAEAEEIKKPEPEEAVTKPVSEPVSEAAETASRKDDSQEEEKTDETKPDSVFRLHNNKLESNIVVKGSIDLDSINDRTRPPRKSRAQRKKERLEREQKALDTKKLKEEKVKQLKKEAIDEKKKQPDTSERDNDSAKKKRKRIRSGQVNIDKPTAYTQGSKSNNKKLSLRKPLKAEVSEEDVQKQIKETLARLTEKRGKKAGAKYRREKREASAQRQQEELKQQEKASRILQLTEFVTANDLANMMNVPVTNVISTCMSLGVMVAINQRLDAETINIVAEEYGFKTQYVSADVIEAIADQEDAPEDLIPRPPIVTVMGHVDHGKTSLLDSIRSTNVIAGEAGGITQHIGAYNVQLSDGRKITFLDTPGHEAFTAMRARGAKVTDVAIIIVAADDNVMPQTVEAINHAGAAGVPIVFAINKIDKPGANPEKIKERLAEMNYLVEDWGGKYQSQDISAKSGIGINELLEKVLLEADLLELKANPNRRATGSIIESSLDKGRGYMATVLVENGTLRQGDIVLAGSYFGRVKAMFNERNQRIEEARPSEPALILGLNGAPQAGDTFNVMETEQEARSIANRREQLQREQSLRTQKMLTLDDIGRRIAIGSFQQLNIIVKGDVDGSVEALSDSLIRLSTEEIQVNVIHKAAGQISESDVSLAAVSDAIIIGFQVRPSLGARKEAEKEGVDIRLYSIIYDAIEEVKAAMEGMLSPDIKEEITGNVEVLEVFKISKVGTVAGCMVRDGKIKRASRIRLIRDGIVIFTGELESLKRFKEDVKEVTSGYECGVTIRNFNDIKVGDVVEAYEETEVKKKL
ncbi:translation initiation factor IF-2 [Proteiniphilum sp. X52]|uniref:translation initiation factor IF-2 n=1 Tax=Proteiniphilum sp. X52 TaxID=2382159 RepID=UPI000F0A0854|nr:translation initiation factor IF-2 [Proteiniphilum sp. X52]RNC66896.1 translation initiation factor IF-2 [Proteiniphilum sp. X52]